MFADRLSTEIVKCINILHDMTQPCLARKVIYLILKKCSEAALLLGTCTLNPNDEPLDDATWRKSSLRRGSIPGVTVICTVHWMLYVDWMQIDMFYYIVRQPWAMEGSSGGAKCLLHSPQAIRWGLTLYARCTSCTNYHKYTIWRDDTVKMIGA